MPAPGILIWQAKALFKKALKYKEQWQVGRVFWNVKWLPGRLWKL